MALMGHIYRQKTELGHECKGCVFENDELCNAPEDLSDKCVEFDINGKANKIIQEFIFIYEPANTSD